MIDDELRAGFWVLLKFEPYKKVSEKKKHNTK